MKILCVSDQIDPLIYSQNARKNFPDVDLILCAGDLPMDYVDFIVSVFNVPTYFVFGNHNLNEFKYYHGFQKNPGSRDDCIKQGFQGFEASSKTTHENHNHGAIYAGFKVLRNNSLLIKNQKTGTLSPLLIAGASGSKRYNNGQCQYTDFQMRLHLISMIPGLILNRILYGRYLDIFLTHATPSGIHDKEDPCHQGFDCFKWFIKHFRPSYMVHGHIHLYDQRDERHGKYFNTIVVNSYAHCVINHDLDDPDFKKDNVKIET